MDRFEREISSYGSYHTQKTNKLLHIIGTPVIIYGILVAASHVTITFFGTRIAGEWLLAGGLAAWYVFFHLIYGGIAGVWILGLAALVTNAWQLNESGRWFLIAGTQILGWALLFIGHFVEKRKPALLDNLSHVLNAAPFVTAEAIEMITGKNFR